MKKVSQGGTELIVFKRQETGNWVGGLLPEEQLLPDQTVLETGKIAHRLPERTLLLLPPRLAGQKAVTLNSLLS